MKRWFSVFVLLGIFFCVSAGLVLACESCGSALARVDSEGKFSESAGTPVFFDFTFEQQVWHKRDPQLVHTLHHQGHDSHDKTHEEFYHFGLGGNLGGRVSLLAQLPFVVRHSLNVDSHEHLGERQRSEGFGDLNLTGIFKALKKGDDYLGPLAGIKFPTGVTSRRDKHGDKFEPEMQPGSGSFDPSMGAAFAYALGRAGFHGNAIYTIRKEGAQDFKFGNLFSAYLYADYLLNPASRNFQTKLGMDFALQKERRQKDRNGTVEDSGGTTFLLGPQIAVRGNRYVSLFGNILFPAYQNLGGLHQTVRFVWNAGIKISF